jgi:hypothetical protein
MMVLRIAVVAVYGYVIVLSLWAMRVQLKAARVPHHPYEHRASSHIVERFAHGYIAGVLIFSLSVRLGQLNLDITPWLLVPLTILVALLTARLLSVVWSMAYEDLFNWYIGFFNKVKTFLLLTCTAALFVDQVWRVVTLFWF